MAIWFNSEVEKFDIKNKRKVKEWIANRIQEEQCNTGTINYIFLNDKDLQKLNSEYLNHYSYTDIISFDYSQEKLISGDIYISIERVRENALLFNNSVNDELKRVIIHGILHLLGFKDSTKMEKSRMRDLENDALSYVKDLLITKG